eukprot:Nk52_evm83s210 gene=Nk52_evmTU83s210
MMRIVDTLQTKHEDLIHDVSYNFYGDRIASSSSDHRIKIWDKIPSSNEWICTADWKAHTGSVWKVVWAHPEFGQVIASCSCDRTVGIWEEQLNDSLSSATKQKGKSTWIKRTTLVDSKDSVMDIKFGPKHRGLQLATCSADGWVRIYEACDIMNLSSWPLLHEFEDRKGYQCNCISWNCSRTPQPMLAIGSAHSSVNLREYDENTRKFEVVGVLTGHTGPVHDVEFAPSMGRSYQLIATASKDCTVKLWKITPNASFAGGDTKGGRLGMPGIGRSGQNSGSGGGQYKYSVELVETFEDHEAEVWRVQWNCTGTILSSSGDDGKVRLWKANYLQKWNCMSIVSCDTPASLEGEE